MFAIEVQHFEEEFKEIHLQNQVFKRIIDKQTKIIKEYEMRSSSQDLRSIFSNDMSPDFVDLMASKLFPLVSKKNKMHKKILSFYKTKIFSEKLDY